MIQPLITHKVQLPWLSKTFGMSLLILSFFALLSAPLLMPDSYNWFQHTTSESAAQGIQGAWLARLGFMLFGLAIIWLPTQLQHEWAFPLRLLHLTFGVCMIGAAVFSSKPWLPTLVFDPMEDFLHSFFATVMGFAFAGGVAGRLFLRIDDWRGRIFDLVAVVASVAIPLAMSALPEWDGLLQRGMFSIAYVWYGLELMGSSETAT